MPLSLIATLLIWLALQGASAHMVGRQNLLTPTSKLQPWLLVAFFLLLCTTKERLFHCLGALKKKKAESQLQQSWEVDLKQTGLQKGGAAPNCRHPAKLVPGSTLCSAPAGKNKPVTWPRISTGCRRRKRPNIAGEGDGRQAGRQAGGWANARTGNPGPAGSLTRVARQGRERFLRDRPTLPLESGRQLLHPALLLQQKRRASFLSALFRQTLRNRAFSKGGI